MAPLKRRSAATWDVARLHGLMLALDAALNSYIAQCYEAADRSPQYRAFWEAEAAAAETQKDAALHKVQMWIDYAGGKSPELMR